MNKIVKKNAKALETTAATIGDNSIVMTKEFNAGLKTASELGIKAKTGAETAARATLDLGLLYRRLVADKVVEIKDDKARAALVAKFRPDSSYDSLKTLRSQIGSFAQTKVIAAIAATGYVKLVPSGGDFFAKCCKVNTGINKAEEKPTVNAAWVESRLAEKGATKLTKKEVAALPAKKQLPIVFVSLNAAIEPFRNDKIRAAANLTPAQDKALTTLLALISTKVPAK